MARDGVAVARAMAAVARVVAAVMRVAVAVVAVAVVAVVLQAVPGLSEASWAAAATPRTGGDLKGTFAGRRSCD